MKLLASCAGLAGSVLFAALATSAAAQARPECRDVTVSEGGKPKRTTMCKGADGQWRPVTATGAASAAGGPLPANFRGQITYRGSYEAVAHQPIRVPRRLTVRNVTSALGGGPREQGTVTYVIEYDGNLVTGTYTGANARGRNSGRFSGTRQGNQCRLFDERTQAPYVATCDAGIFRGEARSEPSARVSSRTEFDAAATETVDYVVRDRQRAEDARTRAEQERQRQAEATRAAERERQRIAAMPLAGAPTTRTIETAIRSDSRSWLGESGGMFGNRYDVGTVRNARIASGTASNGTVRAEYSYNGGSAGWLEARLEGGRVVCLRYWDTNGCAPVRTASPSGRRGIDRSEYGPNGEPANYKYKLDVTTRQWVGVTSGTDEDQDRYFYAASAIQRSGNVVTLNTLFFNSAFDGRAHFDKRRIDCRAMTVTGIDDGVLREGSIIYAQDSDDGTQNVSASSILGGVVTQICSGKALRPLPDVRQAGFGFVQ